MKNSEDVSPVKIKPMQELLVRALVSEDQVALEYCKQWLKNVDLENIDGGSYSLMPMLYKKLVSLGSFDIKSDTMDRLKGICGSFLSMNNLIIPRFSKTLETLHNAGIRVMLLKGIAMILGGYYEDYSLRPMDDIDILIESERADEAIKLLVQRGWRKDSAISYFHSVEMVKDEGYVLDVHLYLLSQNCWKDIDSDLWEYASIVDLKGIPLYMLDPVDQILENCAHGVKWNRIPSFRWIVDVVTIIDLHKDSIDWERLIENAKKRLLTLTLFHALQYLESLAEGRIPGWVLAELKKIPVNEREKILFTAFAREPGNARRHWALHTANNLNRALFYRLITFPLYLRSIYGLRNLFVIPGFLIKKIFRN